MIEKYVSIILPTYNRGELITDSIESVLKQTYPFFELIVVDDASKDNTEHIVKSFSDERIRYIKLEKNSGPSVARNMGIKNARYEYIAFEDSDDVWLPQKLEKQMEVLDEFTGLVYCAYRYESPGYAFRVPSEYRPLEELEGNIFNSLWKQNAIGTPTIVVKKECLQQVGMFSENIKSLEDWELVLRIAECYKIKFINEALVVAKYSETGVNHQNIERAKSILYILKEFQDKNLDDRHMVEYLLEDMAFLSDGVEKENLKKQIIPKYISTEAEYHRVLKYKAQNKNMLLYNKILEAFCDEEIFNKFVEKNINVNETVAIYGMGVIGRALFKRLRAKRVRVIHLIDRNGVQVDGKETIKPEELSGMKVDKVFVSIPYQYESIVNVLDVYIQSSYIDVKDIIYMNGC